MRERSRSGAVIPAAGEVIRLAGVTKNYQAGVAPALLDVHLTVTAGEVVAIMGHSGSGKSTLLNLVAGLDRPSTGQVSLAGRRIDKLSESALARFRARHVGIVFQFFNLLDDLTVEDNVLLPAQLAGASRRQARARAGELLAQLGIANTATPTRPGCRAGSGSGWRLPGPWSTARSCCWPMSRPEPWTPPPGRRSRPCCGS